MDATNGLAARDRGTSVPVWCAAAILVVVAGAACSGNDADRAMPVTTDDRSVSEVQLLSDGVAVSSTEPALEPTTTFGVDVVPLSPGIPDAIDITVPGAPAETIEPVPFSEPAGFGDGVEVRVIDQAAIDVVTALPGEIGGPAVVLTLEFTNRTAASIDLGVVIVDLVLPGQVSANQVTTDPATPVSGTLAAQEGRLGTYVFAVPLDRRDAVDLLVRYSATAPTVVFSGSVVDA